MGGGRSYSSFHGEQLRNHCSFFLIRQLSHLAMNFMAWTVKYNFSALDVQCFRVIVVPPVRQVHAHSEPILAVRCSGNVQMRSGNHRVPCENTSLRIFVQNLITKLRLIDTLPLFLESSNSSDHYRICVERAALSNDRVDSGRNFGFLFIKSGNNAYYACLFHDFYLFLRREVFRYISTVRAFLDAMLPVQVDCSLLQRFVSVVEDVCTIFALRPRCQNICHHFCSIQLIARPAIFWLRIGQTMLNLEINDLLNSF